MSLPYISLGSEPLDTALLSVVEVRQHLNDHWTCRIVVRDTPDRRPPVEAFAGEALQISTFDLLGTEWILFQGLVRRMRLIYEVTGAYGAEIEAVSTTWTMAQGARQRYFRQQTAQAAVQAVVGDAGLSLVGTMPAGANLSYVQWGETDYSFAARLIDDVEAWFRPAVDGSGGLEVQTAFGQGATVNWRAGEYGLLEWTTSGSLRPVTAEGAHYDSQPMQSQVFDPASSSVPMFGNSAARMVQAANTAAAQVEPMWADRHRAATLTHLSDRLGREARRGLANTVVCTGVSRNPQVRAGDTLAVTGLPEVDGVYGVLSAVHCWTPQGYENTFTATPAQRWSPPERPARPMLDGLYPARVVANHDPHNQGRIRVSYYWQEANGTSWVRLLTAHAGSGRGLLFYPEVGDEVLIAFEEGDAERPYVVGSAWNGAHQPPAAGFHQPGETNGGEFAANNIKRIVTKSGHRITMVDTPGKETISVATPTNNRLMLTERHGDTGRPAIVLETQGDMILAAPNGRIHSQSLLHSREVGDGSYAPTPFESASPVLSPETHITQAKQGRSSQHGDTHECSGIGLATPENKKQFAQDMKTLQSHWPDLSPEQRRAALANASNRQLSKNGVPPVQATSNPLLGDSTLGQLNFQKWSLDLNPKLTSSPHLTDAQTEKLGNTLFHESRHADQWYLIARNEAGQGQTAQQIADTTRMPLQTAQSAVKQPLKKGESLYSCSESIKDSVYGSGAQKRNETLTDLSSESAAVAQANAKYQHLVTNPNATATEKSKALHDAEMAYKRLQPTYKRYRDLPEEADAWQAGDAVGAILHH